MKLSFLILALYSFQTFAALDDAALIYSMKVKAEAEKALSDGVLRFDYDEKRNITRTWRDKNISPKDLESLINAFNIAHDLERKIRLSRELKSSKYIHTDFSERVGPYLPVEDLPKGK